MTIKENCNVNEQPRKEFKLVRYLYYLQRGFVRLMLVPACLLQECDLKVAIRRFILQFQHSLPTELVVNRGDTVIQVGTPWPRTMRRFRKAVGDHGKLFIIEAEPRNPQRLKQAIEDDGYDNVYLVKAAAWSETRPGKLTICAYFGDHKIHQDDVAMDNDLRPMNAETEEIDVEFLRIDDMADKYGIKQIDYLSVTVNGAEYEVLKGARELLGRSKSARTYAKGHARIADGRPLHTITEPFMRELGYKTVITRGETSSTLDKSWLNRAGDLFAWR